MLNRARTTNISSSLLKNPTSEQRNYNLVGDLILVLYQPIDSLLGCVADKTHSTAYII